MAIQAHQVGFFIIGLVAAVGVIYAYQVGRRMKGYLGFKLKRAGVGMFAYTLGVLILPHYKYSVAETVTFAFILAVAVGFFFVRPPRISRRIPRRVRTAVIARDLRGEPFDPRLHQIDHVVPLSRGGDNSVENLRVIGRERNLQKSARMPGLKDLLGKR